MPHWPGDARIARQFRNQFRGGLGAFLSCWGRCFPRVGLTEMPGADLGVTGRDLAAESMFEYGRAGRLLAPTSDLHPLCGPGDDFRLPPGPSRRNPPAAAAIAASDWDICSHGYRWTNHPGLSEAEERRQIAEAVELIRRTTGKTPGGLVLPLRTVGKYPPPVGSSMAGSSMTVTPTNDELPYWVRVNDRPQPCRSVLADDQRFEIRPRRFSVPARISSPFCATASMSSTKRVRSARA